MICSFFSGHFLLGFQRERSSTIRWNNIEPIEMVFLTKLYHFMHSVVLWFFSKMRIYTRTFWNWWCGRLLNLWPSFFNIFRLCCCCRCCYCWKSWCMNCPESFRFILFPIENRFRAYWKHCTYNENTWHPAIYPLMCQVLPNIYTHMSIQLLDRSHCECRSELREKWIGKRVDKTEIKYNIHRLW